MKKILDGIHKTTPITLLIYGMARGADDMAKMWATARDIERYGFPADWETHGRNAGPIRNREMLVKGKPDRVVAFPIEESRGTWDMINQARRANVPVTVIE